MRSRRVPLLIGLLLALGTGALLLNYLVSLRASAPVARTQRVWVATRDIPARSLIVDSAIAQVAKDTADLDSDAIVARSDIAGRYSLITIPAGSVLTHAKLGALGAFALPARLPVGMRAVSIAIDRVKGVSGLIQPGDRVDVIAVPPRVGDETPIGSAILRGALVLAMGNETEVASATPGPANQDLTTVTLAVTPSQANVLASADINTILRLALRSPKEPLRAFAPEPLHLGVAQRSTAPVSASAAIPAAPPAPVPAAAAPAIAPAAAPIARVPRGSVIVIDGDRVVGGTGQAR